MESFPFLEGSRHSGEVPGVIRGLEPLRQILGPQDPGVVGKPSHGIGTRVSIHQLPGRRDPDCLGVETEFLGILDEVKQMRMRPAELEFAVHTERVVPDHPTSAVEPQGLRQQLQLGCVFISNRQPEGAVRLEDTVDFRDPIPAPGEVLIGSLPVVVDVVLVTDVEGRVGEHEIHPPLFQLTHPLDAVEGMNGAIGEHLGALRAGWDRRADHSGVPPKMKNNVCRWKREWNDKQSCRQFPVSDVTGFPSAAGLQTAP